jgi:predicted ATPase
LEVREQTGHFSLMMHQKGLLRPLSVSELSEGTLRFIMLAAALLTPRPPPLMVLNEPETGLNPALMQHLCNLIGEASRNCQIVVVSHQEELVRLLLEGQNRSVLNLKKEMGETVFEGQEMQSWEWPSR